MTMGATGPVSVGFDHACPVCGGRVADRPFVQNRLVTLYPCTSCGGLSVQPRPSAEALASIHDSESYFNHPYFEHRRLATDAVERRCQEIFKRIGKAIDLASLRGARHLDVGCDTGEFLSAASRLCGTTPIGIDVAHRAIAVAKQRGLDAHCCSLEDAAPEISNAKLITLIDLIEHVTDPAALLMQVRRRLADDGICYIETPNFKSSIYGVGRMLTRLTGGRPPWISERLFPAEHVQYLTVGGVRRMAAAAGFEVVDISTRSLPRSDIAASPVVRLVLEALQSADGLVNRGILLCVTLRVAKGPQRRR